MLVTPPACPPPLPDGQVETQIIGPPRIMGWPAEDGTPGQSVAELLTLLALHPEQTFSAEQLRDRLGTGRPRDLDSASIRRYVGELRRALGDERIPEARAAGGYTVKKVSTDAGRFAALVSQANAAASATTRAEHLADALALVRGAPFASRPAGSYGWAETGTNIAAAIANTVLNTAVELAELAITAGDNDLASWAVERGLLVWPTDESLHQLALTAAAKSGPARLERTWTQTQTRLAAEGQTPSPTLEDHYRQLHHSTQTARA